MSARLDTHTQEHGQEMIVRGVINIPGWGRGDPITDCSLPLFTRVIALPTLKLASPLVSSLGPFSPPSLSQPHLRLVIDCTVIFAIRWAQETG